MEEGETAWGTCHSSATCLDAKIQSDLLPFVGRKTVNQLGSGCACQDGQYGPYCTSIKQDGDLGLCGEGSYNEKNYLSGCDCRDTDGHVIPYHGWYCEHHNVMLCSEGYFYNVTAMKDEVGHGTQNVVCVKCENFISNCAECEQNQETECKFISYSQSRTNT